MLTTVSAAPLLAPADVVGTAARKVVVLLADAETQASMLAWCDAHGFDLAASFGGEPRDPAEFQFHLTLFATVGPSYLPDQAHEIEPVPVEPTAFDALGADASTPVLLTLSTLRLIALRMTWLSLAAAEPTYPDFKPHVSLSYAWNGTPALDSLPLPDFPLVFDRLKVSTLDAPLERSARMQQTVAAGSKAGTLFERLQSFGEAPVDPLEPEVIAALQPLPGGAALAMEHQQIADRARAAHSALSFAQMAVDAATAHAAQRRDEWRRETDYPMKPDDESRLNSAVDEAIAHRDEVRDELAALVDASTVVENRIADLIATA